MTLWRDPATDDEWVYAALDPVDEATYGRVVRFPIGHPDTVELVWDKTPISEDNFQVSQDGRLASGLFPWPAAGVAELPNGSWRQLGDGCWTSFTEMGRPLCWYLDGAHRNLTIVDVEADDRWRVNINRVPGFTGAEVYHPRWTNDPRFLTMTGPYDLGGENQVRTGGPQVEVYLGRFSSDFTRVDQWARVTRNDHGDAYPDVWIDRGTLPSDRLQVPSTGDADPPTVRPPDTADGARLVVEARLTTAGIIPSPQSILPYRHALVVSAYEVVRVLEGQYAEPTVLVAQWAIRESRVLSTARRTPGAAFRLTLEPYDAHPELEGERLVMDTDDATLPLYYDTGS